MQRGQIILDDVVDGIEIKLYERYLTINDENDIRINVRLDDVTSVYVDDHLFDEDDYEEDEEIPDCKDFCIAFTDGDEDYCMTAGRESSVTVLRELNKWVDIIEDQLMNIR